jgi:hypothetical protein
MSKNYRRNREPEIEVPEGAKIIEVPASGVPTKKQMEEMFYEVVAYSKEQGCPVTVYKNKAKVNGSNGYFTSEPRPHIKVGLKGRSWPKSMQLIIHEFCHYWQWKDGFLGHKDDDGNIAYARLLEGEELSPKERIKASTLVRISEYDCEIRTDHLFERWNLQSIFPKTEHIKSSNTYNRHIVWSIGDDTYPGSGIFYAKYDTLGDQLWGRKVFNHFWDPKTSAGKAKLLAPLSKEHRAVFDKAAGITRDEEGRPVKKKRSTKRRKN